MGLKPNIYPPPTSVTMGPLDTMFMPTNHDWPPWVVGYPRDLNPGIWGPDTICIVRGAISIIRGQTISSQHQHLLTSLNNLPYSLSMLNGPSSLVLITKVRLMINQTRLTYASDLHAMLVQQPLPRAQNRPLVILL
jgi:hypothetical protein